MATAPDHIPDDMDALKLELIETRAKLSGAHALIEHLQLLIEKMKRTMFGPRSERSQRLLDQLELQLEELTAAAGEDAAKAESAGIRVESFTRRKATRRNFPDHLPRRRIVHPAPTSCPCCGGTNLSKLGEDVTETLDVVPRQWFVTEHVREKFSCRACETITQPPAPFHAIARGYAGPSLLAMIMVDTRFLNDGRICLSNNAAERALRGIALGRKAWLFAGSDRGGERAAVMYTLIQTAKLNDVDPQAWLADVLARIADYKITDLAALLPWNWGATARVDRAA